MNRQIAWYWAAGLAGAFLWATQLSLLAAPQLLSNSQSTDEQNAPPKSQGISPEKTPEKAPSKTPPKSAKELRDEQLSISGRYARFERMLTQMADILAKQDPERADVIRRALGKGREDLLKDDIENIVQLLERPLAATWLFGPAQPPRPGLPDNHCDFHIDPAPLRHWLAQRATG